MVVEGARYEWRPNMPGAGELAGIATGAALAAGCPGARILVRLRGRRLPGDEVLPSVLPFVGALGGTALWLLPLSYLHPMAPFDSKTAMAWAAAGSLVSLGLFARAWRATRVLPPAKAGAAASWPDRATGEAAGPGEVKQVFLPARFLEDTDFNPHHFGGTHVVLGGGPPRWLPTTARAGSRPGGSRWSG